MIQARSQLVFVLVRLPLALLASAMAARLCAVSYSGPVANWQMRDGLPSNKVMAALQTRDGYIWLGTFDGVARFDGVAFTRFDAGRTSGLVDSSATALCESPDGALWIGHSSGSVTRMREGQLKSYPPPAERGGARIQSLACDEAGDMWAYNVVGQLIRVRDDFTLVPDAGAARGIYFMAGSPQGSLAVVSRGKLSILAQGKLHPIEVPAEMGPFVQGVCGSRDGAWWVVTGGQLWKWREGEWTSFPHAVPTGPAPVFSMTELRDGRIVGATYDAGAWIIDPASSTPEQRFAQATGFASDWITSVFEDHEGGVWLGTGTAGVCRYSEKKIRMLVPPGALDGRAVLAVAEGPDQALWIGTEGRGVYRYQNGEWVQFRVDAGLTNSFVWSVAATADGTGWAGTWGSGVFRFHDGRFIGPESRTGTAETAVAAIIPSARGGVLVGAHQGVYRWNGTEADWLEPGSNRAATNVRALLEEEGGHVVWAGCWGRGLVRIAGGEVRRYTHGDGLSSNDINCLYRDRHDALWIGTNGGGLNRLKDGRISAVGTANGLSDNSIGHIVEDADGNIWLSSRGGLMRVSAEQLNACADGTLARVDAETFGYSEGLTTLNFSTSLQPAGCTLRNGELAFATDRGVALVDPAHLQRNPVPPPVLIEWIGIDDRRLAVGEDSTFSCEVPAGFERLEIKYTALSFAGPEKVVFRRQLQPLERRPTGVRGERSVVYNYIPPGTYTFHVTAANNDGIWATEARSIKLVVLPFFWQTTWFRIFITVSVVAASGTIAWSISRRRLQRRVEALERERAIERERTRIANDMHDELGSQLTRITMLSESAQRQSSDAARVGERLGQIHETARDVTKAMDEIVWTVNPKHDTLESLVTYVERFALDFLGTAGIGCRIHAPFEPIAWTPNSEVRHHLFLCIKEVLTNVVRHSGATLVTLTIRPEPGHLFVQIADNGRGLTASPSRDPSRAGGGNGQANVRERMARIGGSCEITSPPGGGCTVTFMAPMSLSVSPTGRHSDL